MKANETQNEKNYQLLKQRFTNESQFEIHNEVDYGNEPLKIKVTDSNGNENEHEIEKLTGNGFETTLHFKNENENETGNENRNGNGNGFENENENENELGNETRNEIHFRNETGNEILIKNELIKQMKNEILFHTTDKTFKQESSIHSRANYIQIRIINKDNVEDLVKRYTDTVNYYLEQEYLAIDEVEDFKLACERLKGIREIQSRIKQEIMLDELYDKMTVDDKETFASRIKKTIQKITKQSK